MLLQQAPTHAPKPRRKLARGQTHARESARACVRACICVYAAVSLCWRATCLLQKSAAPAPASAPATSRVIRSPRAAPCMLADTNFRKSSKSVTGTRVLITSGSACRGTPMPAQTSSVSRSCFVSTQQSWSLSASLSPGCGAFSTRLSHSSFFRLSFHVFFVFSSSFFQAHHSHLPTRPTAAVQGHSGRGGSSSSCSEMRDVVGKERTEIKRMEMIRMSLWMTQMRCMQVDSE